MVPQPSQAAFLGEKGLAPKRRSHGPSACFGGKLASSGLEAAMWWVIDTWLGFAWSLQGLTGC